MPMYALEELCNDFDGLFYACYRCQLPLLGILVVIMDHFLLINQEIAMERTAM